MNGRILTYMVALVTWYCCFYMISPSNDEMEWLEAFPIEEREWLEFILRVLLFVEWADFFSSSLKVCSISAALSAFVWMFNEVLTLLEKSWNFDEVRTLLEKVWKFDENFCSISLPCSCFLCRISFPCCCDRSRDLRISSRLSLVFSPPLDGSSSCSCSFWFLWMENFRKNCGGLLALRGFCGAGRLNFCKKLFPQLFMGPTGLSLSSRLLLSLWSERFWSTVSLDVWVLLPPTRSTILLTSRRCLGVKALFRAETSRKRSATPCLSRKLVKMVFFCSVMVGWSLAVMSMFFVCLCQNWKKCVCNTISRWFGPKRTRKRWLIKKFKLLTLFRVPLCCQMGEGKNHKKRSMTSG